MRFTTAIPGVVARLTDLVERNVDANIELHQEAAFSYPPIPEVLRIAVPDINPQRESFQTEAFQHLINPNPAVTTDLFVLGRGLWKLDIHACYAGNFLTDAAGETAILRIRDNTQGFAGFHQQLWRGVMPGTNTQSVSSFLSYTFATDVDGYTVQFFLGAPPAATQSHTVSICVMGSKIL